MTRRTDLPLLMRCRMAARAAWACLTGDAAVQRIPLRSAERRPMCASLAQCVQTCHRLEQTEARLADLARQQHPSAYTPPPPPTEGPCA